MTGAAGVAATTMARRAAAQTPQRGGVLSLRLWDPPHFDHILAHAYRTHVLISFTHSRLVRHKAGPSVAPGAFPIEADLADSWQQVNDTTYVFKLRKGVRFHAKAPVNGRELTADDVRYTFERILTEKGSAAVSMYRSIAKVEATDRYTVKFTLKEPFAWFLDMLANPMTGAIIARECVEKFGDLKKPEAVIGTGPWMLDAYKPNQSLTLVRNPTYFVAALPYIDRVDVVVDEDNASRTAAFLAGKFDLGWENPGTINRSDWVQIADTLKTRRPGLKTAEFTSNVVSDVFMRTDKPPFNDPRVRQAVSLAIDRKGFIDATLEGVGVVNGPMAAALADWALPIAELGEGARYYRYDPAEAKRLLAAAGHPKGFQASVCFATYGSTQLVDQMQLVLKYLKDVGIDAKLDQKEYGA
jgi:peptide/nickel transport system substrate-binding protein